LRDLAVVLGAAAVTATLFQRLGQPIVLGYLLAGLVIGPHVTFQLVADQASVRTLAETGVILLMFSIGLEFRLGKLIRVARTAGVVAVLQVAFMLWLGYVTARLFGWKPLEAVFTGAVLSISSTTIIAKAFDAERVAPPLREWVFAILIVEDLLGISILATLTTITEGELSAGEVAATEFRLVGFLLVLLVAGMLIVPRLVRRIVALDRPETTLVATVGICFGLSLLARWMGYSVALGAFVAGSLVAESGEAAAVERLVQPVKDLFAAVFFVAVGMMIDPALIAHHFWAVLALTGVVVLGKLVGVSVGTFLVGGGLPTAIQSGLSLAQIGEFSFIIASLGVTSGATRQFLYPVAVAVSASTTLLTPWLIRSSERVANAVDNWLPPPLQTFVTLYGTWIERLRHRPARRSTRALKWLLTDALLLATVVIGASLFSEPLAARVEEVLHVAPRMAELLVTSAALALALPFAVGIFRVARKLGETWALNVLPKPAGQVADLSLAPRRALAAATQLGSVLIVGLALTAITQPFLPLAGAVLGAAVLVMTVVFWRSARNLEGHVRAGAEVIAEALARESRGDQGAPLAQIDELVPGIGHPVVVRLGERHAGKLRDLKLRTRTGATVIAVRRGEESIVSPGPDQRLQPGDLLVLVGTGEAVEAARALLSG
jgi:CPA2 family monovalent cation:H+ antiporter-2